MNQADKVLLVMKPLFFKIFNNTYFWLPSEPYLHQPRLTHTHRYLAVGCLWKSCADLHSPQHLFQYMTTSRNHLKEQLTQHNLVSQHRFTHSINYGHDVQAWLEYALHRNLKKAVFSK